MTPPRGVYMVDVQKNEQINQELSALYQKCTKEYLAAYCSIFHDPEPPCRINEFGIIDENRYNSGRGILFVAKETNGWCNDDFEAGHLFRGWMADISQQGLAGKGHVQRHPTMWYNLGRWAMYLNDITSAPKDRKVGIMKRFSQFPQYAL